MSRTRRDFLTLLTSSALCCVIPETLRARSRSYPSIPTPIRPPAAAVRIGGAFIQFWEDLLNESAWRGVLDSMVRAEMHYTIILQRLEVKDSDGNEHVYYAKNSAD